MRCPFSGSFVVAVVAVLTHAHAAVAQPAAAPPQRAPAQLTPFAALGDDYAPGAGISYTLPIAARFGLEVEASAGTDALRSGVSLLVDVVRFGSVQTYVAGGAGVQRDESDRPDFSGSPFRRIKITEFAVGVGGGAIVPVGPRWSYRVDFRWYNPKAEWPESWRLYNGLALRLSRD
jgi:hypothetical protein